MRGRATISPYRVAIGGLTIWAYFSLGISFQAVSPILPIITREYDISYASAGLLVGVVLIIQGAFCIPLGYLTGRLGLKRMYTLAWFLMGTLTLAALSPNFYGLLTLRILYGLGTAVVVTATGPLIMQWFRPRELPVITSLNTAAVSAGFMLSVSTAAPLADIIGWQRVLGLFGGMGLVGAFAWASWGKEREGPGPVIAPISLTETWDVLRNPVVLLLGLANAAGLAQYLALSGWLPTFYHQTRDMSLTEAGLVVSLLPFMGIFAVLLGGFLTRNIRSRRVFFIVPGLMLGLGGLGSFLLDNAILTYGSVVLVGFGTWLYMPAFFVMPMELPGMTPQKVAIAWGWLISASGVAAFVSPLVVGALRDSVDSFIPGFLIFAVLSWFVVIAGLVLPETRVRPARLPGPAASPAAGGE